MFYPPAMLRSRRVMLPLLLAGALGTFVQNSHSQEGEYLIEGKDPQGNAYSGKGTISAKGDHWQLDWTTEGAEAATGPMLWHDGILVLGYAGGGARLLAAYTLDSGRLQGHVLAPWTNDQVRLHELRGSESLSGRYTSADAGGTDELMLTPEGGRLRVAWTHGDETLHGIAVRQGNHLAVVCGGGNADEITAVDMHWIDDGKAWTGVWGISDQTNLGLTTLRPVRGSVFPPKISRQQLLVAGETYALSSTGAGGAGDASETRTYIPFAADSVASVPKRLEISFIDSSSKAGERLHAELDDLAKASVKHEEAVLSDANEAATGLILQKSPQSAAVHVLHVFRLESGLVLVHLQLRSMPPFDAYPIFMAEQRKRIDDWVRDVELLGRKAVEIIDATRPAR